MADMKYLFRTIERCNMCHSDGESQKKFGRRLNCSGGLNPSKKVGISTTVMKCSRCGLIYSNPQPIPLDLAMHYDIPVNDYYSTGFLDVADQGLSYPGEINFANVFKQHHRGHQNPSVLDLGCGIGSTLVHYKKAGFDIYGLEPSTTFYEKTRDFLGEDFKNIVNTPFENAPYGRDQFDFIYSFNVLEHVYDPHLMIQKALEWLKPSGMLGIMVPSANWLTSKILNFYYLLRGTDLVTNISPMHNPFHLYEFEVDSFMQNAKVGGYHVHTSNIVATSTHLPKFLDPILLPLMDSSKTGLRLEVILQKQS